MITHAEHIARIDQRIIDAFSHLYPYVGPNYFTVEHSADGEVYTIRCSDEDVPAQRAVVESDDDGYLRFTVFDEDDSPYDDDLDVVSVRVQIDREGDEPVGDE